jgi:hypothetical protein
MFLLSSIEPAKRKRLGIGVSACSVAVLIAAGVMAGNGWLPHTDPASGQKFGWFAKLLPRNATSVWNPLPMTTPTPQLSKEYIYAGSRLLAVEDANASAVPPADLAVWRPSDGYWYVMGGPGSQETSFSWGTGDVFLPAPGDYDGDGKTDFCVVSQYSVWYIYYSSTSTSTSMSFGLWSDDRVPADYDGDGKTDMAVFRPSTGTWYIYQSSTSATVTKTLGQSGDKAAPADYDGDGKADSAIWRAGTSGQFIVLRSSDNQTQTVNLGSTSGTPVSADYDGDGKADFALLSGDVWTILQSSNGTVINTTWESGVPVQNDYDGDGKVDIAVWKAKSIRIGRVTVSKGIWYILNSHDRSTRSETWGTAGDIPVPAFYRR